MMQKNTPMRTDLTSLERLEAQIRVFPNGAPEGAGLEGSSGGLAEIEGFEPSMGLPPNRISNAAP